MAENLYQQAYNAFTGETYEAALTLCNEGLSKYGEDILVPKFLLLKAYSVGRMGDEREFRVELNNLIKIVAHE